MRRAWDVDAKIFPRLTMRGSLLSLAGKIIWENYEYFGLVEFVKCSVSLPNTVGRARFELATNGLKVRCSTD